MTMQEIPNWIIKVIEVEKLKCKSCNKKFSSDNLMTISIQESSRPPHKDYLCIGLYCPKCEDLMVFELKEMSLIDFAFEILDQETSDKIKKKSKDDVPAYAKPEGKKATKRKRKRKKSSITSKEILEAKTFLEPEDLPYEEFLIALGMQPSEIKKYNYKK
jgi:hypothetical protein